MNTLEQRQIPIIRKVLSCVCFIVCYCIQLSFNFHSYFDLFIIVKRQKISTHYWNNSLNKSSCIICLPKPQTQSPTVVLWTPRTLQRLNRCTQRSPCSHPTRATRPRGRIQTHSHPANPPQLLALSKDRQTRKPFLSLQRYPYNTA